MWNIIEKDIANPFNDGKRFLSFIERVAQLAVHGNNIMYIPEDLLKKI